MDNINGYDWAAIITALSLLVTAVAGGWRQLRQIHKAVNSNMENAMKKIDDLRDELAEEQKK